MTGRPRPNSSRPIHGISNVPPQSLHGYGSPQSMVPPWTRHPPTAMSGASKPVVMATQGLPPPRAPLLQPMATPGNLPPNILPNSISELTYHLSTCSYSVGGVMLLRLFDHFFGVLILGGDKGALPPTDTILQLLDDYILCQNTKEKVSTLEEFRMINNFRIYLESSADYRVKLCVFDTVFGTDEENIDLTREKTSVQLTLLTKLTSLAISCGNTQVLDIVSFWMKRYPSQAEIVAKDLYCDFCEMLPVASKPLKMITNVSSQFSSQMLIALTSAFALINEGGLSGCDSVPLELLRIVSEWMKHRPGLLFTLEGQSDNKEKGLPLRRRSVKSKPFQTFQGLVLWSVLLPLIPVSSRGREETVAPPVDTESTLVQPDKGKLSTDSMTMQYQFHTHLLEALLALTSSTNQSWWADPEIIVTIGEVLCNVLASNSGPMEAEESVNRFAQIIQVCSTSGILKGIQEGTKSKLLKELPQNKLLSLVLSNS